MECNVKNVDNSVNALWIGPLGELELLTLHSFSQHKADFTLWMYTEPIVVTLDGRQKKCVLPPGITLRNADEILPKERVFKYPSKMHYGFCGETYIGFSELFRYKVLYERGGWWSDMDVTCLKPLTEITEPYFFRFHGVLPVVGNIMKVPPKSDLMKSCFETAEQEINEHTDDMFQAIEILCYYIRYYGLRNYISKTKCNMDHFWVMEPYFTTYEPFPNEWHFVHWMRSALSACWSQNKLKIREESTFHQLIEPFLHKSRKLHL